MLNYIITLILIIFIAIPGYAKVNVFTKFSESVWGNLFTLLLTLALIIINGFNIFKEQNFMNMWYIIISFVIIICLYVNTESNYIETDESRENYKNMITSCVFSFFTAGGFAYLINKVLGSSCTSDSLELLCNPSLLVLFITMCIGVYYTIITIKNSNSDILFKKTEQSKYEFEGIFIIIIALWQLYLYMVLDGFKLSSDNNMYQIIPILTIIYILYSYITDRVLINQCNDWGDNVSSINNITEINTNIVVTTLIGALIVISFNH